MDKKTGRFLENNIGAILSTLIAAFVVGTFAMVHNSDKNNRVFETKLTYIASAVVELKGNIKMLQEQLRLSNRDRWTKSDQMQYDKRINLRFDKIEDRILRLEITRQKEQN